MEKARNRELSGYSERHHVLPSCMGGKDGEVVRLTAEEHYVAHQLLVKMYPGNRGLIWAAFQMARGNSYQKRNNKIYGWLRRKFSEGVGPLSEETKKKISRANKGKPKTLEHRAALSKARIGLRNAAGKRGPEQINNIRAGRQKMNNEVFRTPEYRAKQSAAAKLIWERRKASKK